MRPTEVVHARIDALTEGLSNAVRKTDGAQFALLLSMIAESQGLASRLESAPVTAADDASLQNRDELYTPEIVGRLNQALKDGQRGEVQLLLSWLETVPLQGRLKPKVTAPEAGPGVPLSQAALMAGRYSMLDEIKESHMRIAA